MREKHLFIAELLEKYPDLSSEEWGQFNQWIDQGDNKNLFRQIIDKDILEEELRQLYLLKLERENRHCWEKLLFRFQLKQQKAKKNRLNTWWIFSAAASIVVIMGVFYYIWYQSDSNNKMIIHEKDVQIQKTIDVNPGRYKAKLTLADGSVLTLDSSSKSSEVQQGNTIIFKNGNQIIYKNKGEPDKHLYNTLTTAKGETYGMVLSDGSRVWLNSQSTLRYPVTFSENERTVEITGEAYFEVASQSNKREHKIPFRVLGNGIIVEVLGTKFNINSYSNEKGIITTLLEGRVKIHSVANNKIALLEPGQQATLNNATQQIIKLDNVDVDLAVAWHYGYFQFNNADVETVLKQLVRWYDVDVIYEGKYPAKTFWGKISKKNTLSQVLNTLETNKVSFKLEGRTIYVSFDSSQNQ